MCYDRLGKILNDTEKIDPLTPKLVKGIMKNDSRAVKSLADRWNWDMLSQEAQSNIDKPEEGVAKASVATGLGFATAGLGNYLQGANAYGAAVPGVAQGSEQAAMLAAQTGDFGAYGLGKTMQAASTADDLGLMGKYAGQYGGNFLSNVGGPRGEAMGRRMMMNSAMDMMQPQPMQPPPPPPRYEPQQPAMSPYMSEEEKRRLLMMMQQQRGIY